MLIGARLVQGIGAGMTQGTGMAVIISSFPSRERGKAIGMIMTIVGSGQVAGPAIGGFLVDTLGWPFVFLINVPIGLVGVVATIAIVREQLNTQEAAQSGSQFDWMGAALSTGALVALLLAMTNGHRHGWNSAPILAAAFSFIFLSAAFIWWELRAPNPMLDLRLFLRKTFTYGVSAALLMFLGSSAVLILMPFYLQGVLGYSAWSAGLIVMPGALFMAFMGPISGALSDRFGPRVLTVGGLAASCMGVFLLSRLTADSSLYMIIPALILTSGGMGTFYSPNTSSVLSAVELYRYGIISALLNLIRNGANIISLAMATAIVTATMGSMGFEPSLDAVRHAGTSGVGHAFSVGLRNGFLTMMGLLLMAMAVSALKEKKEEEVAAVAPTGAGQTPD
jgi:EmrB/QacA subfamily drug resistance transporter